MEFGMDLGQNWERILSGFHDSIVVSIILVISYPLNKLLRLVYQYERNEIK